MALIPVRFANSCYQIELPNGVEAAIRLGGQPVTAFVEGWHPRHVFTGLAVLHILELYHDSGAESFWLLDEGMNHCGLRIDALEAAQQAALMAQLSVLFDRMWTEVFCDSTLSVSDKPRDFLQLYTSTRLAFFDFWKAGTVDRTWICNLADGIPEWVQPRLEAVGAQYDRVQAVLSQDFQAQLGRFVAAGAIVFPSIYTAFDVHTTQSICFNTFGFVYRFVDTVCDRVFYVVLTGHHCVLSCLLIPDPLGDIAICRDEHQYWHMTHILSRTLKTDLLGHLCTVGAMLPTYLQGTPQAFANVQRCGARHMGHMLWNELTGIMKLVEQVPADRLPLCLLPSPAGGELYGPVDRIFPELQGRVVRSIPDAGAFIHYVYQNSLCVIRSTSLIVTQPLRDHILTHVRSLDELAADRDQLAAFRASGAYILTIGLRVENRTVVDMNEFCVKVIHSVAHAVGSLVVVFDGHNAVSLAEAGSYIESNQESRAVEKPIDIERSIVAYAQAQFTGTPVKIIDMVGQSIERALLWIDSSHYFVAPWGTGMAKYSWVCNKPGYVLTQDWNVKNRNDIGIYNEPCNQGAAELTWASADAITPDPDAAILIEVLDWPRPSYENFRVSYQTMLPDLRAALRRAIGMQVA